jgi:hypothetical protein
MRGYIYLMMPQMNPGDARQEHQNPEYGNYAGTSSYSPQQQYSTPYETPPTQGTPYDSHFTDPMAPRMNTGQGPMGKVYTKSQPAPSAGMRLALAIVSICILVPITGIIFGILHASGIVPFIIVCIAIVIVNAIFNNPNLFKS